MGCGGSNASSSAATPAAVPSSAAAAPASGSSNANAAPTTDSAATAAPGPEVAAAAQVEQAKQITKEAFAASMRKLLDLAIEGYPKALRSTLARRNELLRQTNGDQDAAAEIVKASAAAISEEGKTWLLGLVPYIGFPAQLLYPTWKIMRRVCLLAAIFGLDLNAEDTRGRILHVFAGLRAVPAVECGMEMAVQAVWVAFAGPVASILPVGMLVTKVSNVEGHVVDTIGRDTFSEKRRKIPEAEYTQELDKEPTVNDYLSLAKDGTAFALYSTWKGGVTLATTVADKDRRAEAMGQAADVSKNAVATGVAAGTGAVTAGLAVGAGAVALAKDQGPQFAANIAGQAKGALGAVAGVGQKAPADKGAS